MNRKEIKEFKKEYQKRFDKAKTFEDCIKIFNQITNEKKFLNKYTGSFADFNTLDLLLNHALKYIQVKI